MSAANVFLSAAAVGFTLAAPIGPMALLLMRRALTRGWSAAMITGLGIATGDAIYGAVGALGLASIGAFLAAHAQPIHIAAGAVLFAVGVQTLLKRGDQAASSERGEFVRTVVLTLTNPMTIVAYAAATTFLSPPATFDPHFVTDVVLGVFSGSVAWWIVLVTVTTSLRRVIRPNVRRAIDMASGVFLMACGVRTATIR
jgi:threonine/homoserine/homoserine lactone efflux protein